MANIEGTEGNDRILGTADDDRILGFGGSDKLFGWAGDDSLRGNDGIDLLKGRSGDDELVGFGGVDTFRLGSGEDTILVGGPGDGTESVFGWGQNDLIYANGTEGLDNVNEVTVERADGRTWVRFLDAASGEGFDLLLVGLDLDRADVLDQIFI